MRADGNAMTAVDTKLFGSGNRTRETFSDYFNNFSRTFSHTETIPPAFILINGKKRHGLSFLVCVFPFRPHECSVPINDDALISQIGRSLFRKREDLTSECRTDVGLSLYLIRQFPSRKNSFQDSTQVFELYLNWHLYLCR